MELRFLTPAAALFGLTALLPLAVFLVRQRRGRRIRTALGLRPPTLHSRAPLVLALAAVPGLLGLAAAQPIVETNRVRPERVDAEAFVVLDTSRSMLAAGTPGGPTRIERARGLARELRTSLPQVPFGIASLTDRLLPHLFPSSDGRVFESTLVDAVGIERPPPALFYNTNATTLNPLGNVPAKDYFSPDAKRRLLVVLTDGESQPVEQTLGQAFEEMPRVHTLFVRVWGAGERIWTTGVAEDAYRPSDPQGAVLGQAASLVKGRVFAEDDLAGVKAAAAEIVGTGPVRDRLIEGERLALMPWVALAALAPLGLVLLRRNL